MTAADEIAAAATELRADQAGRETVLPSGAIISATLAKPLAAWLEREAFRVLTNGANPELHHALTVARAILGTQETT